MVGGIEGIAVYMDYCCLGQMSRIEMVCMVREFNLEVEDWNFLWVNIYRENKGLREVQIDLDALSIVYMFANSSKEVYVCIRIANASIDHEGNLSGSSS